MGEGHNLLVEIEQDIIEAAQAGWHIVVEALKALAEELRRDLAELFNSAIDALKHSTPIDEIVTMVLNKAALLGWQWVMDLGTEILRGIAALLSAKLPAQAQA